MNRFIPTLAIASVVACASIGNLAEAASISRNSYTQASGACQGALPSYEGSFRKRPLAVANEGTASAFVTCGVRNDENAAVVSSIRLAVTNRAASVQSISCTLVDGLIDATLGFADYYPQTTSAASGVDTQLTWSGGTFKWPAISCNVPGHVELNMVSTTFDDEIGS